MQFGAMVEPGSQPGVHLFFAPRRREPALRSTRDIIHRTEQAHAGGSHLWPVDLIDDRAKNLARADQRWVKRVGPDRCPNSRSAHSGQNGMSVPHPSDHHVQRSTIVHLSSASRPHSAHRTATRSEPSPLTAERGTCADYASYARLARAGGGDLDNSGLPGPRQAYRTPVGLNAESGGVSVAQPIFAMMPFISSSSNARIVTVRMAPVAAIWRATAVPVSSSGNSARPTRS